MSSRQLRILIAVLGTAAVTAYAVVMLLQITVWNPMAAVPGLTLAEIGTQAAARGETVFSAFPAIVAGAGIALAVGILVLAIVSRRVSAPAFAAMYLALLVGGAPAYFTASFGPGMAIADAFATSGGDHAPGGSYLMAVSAAAGVALVVWVVALATSSRRVQAAPAR